jgi:hypothetical protein
MNEILSSPAESLQKLDSIIQEVIGLAPQYAAKYQ